MKSQHVDNIVEIGIAIRKRRKVLGLKQADAAGLLGVGVRFLSELERGKQTLAIGKVFQALRGLGIKIQLLMETDE